MAFTDAKKQFLLAVDFQEDEIAAVEEFMAQKARTAQSEGLRSKEHTTPQPAVQNPAPTQTQEPQPQQQPVDVDAQQKLKEAQDFILKALEPILAPLTAKIESLETQFAQLKQQGESLTPAASALAAKSIIQQS